MDETPQRPDAPTPSGDPTNQGDQAFPRHPRTEDPAPGSQTRARLAVLLPVALVVVTAATTAAAAIGRLDSALFFVGVPVLLALVVGVLPATSTGGLLFQVITVTLLLVSAFLHEGALCVLIVSPLLYGSAFFVWWLVRAAANVQQRLAVVPLLALAALEGAVPGTRIMPTQEATAERVVAGACADFVAGLDRPTFSTDDRGWLLRVAQYPTPTTAEGSGLAVGDRWELAMPAGAISTRVSDRTGDDTTGGIDFEVTDDTARTTRWVTLQQAHLSWAESDEGCRTRLAIDFERDLDPALYFGPITDLFMSAGAKAFLTGLD